MEVKASCHVRLHLMMRRLFWPFLDDMNPGTPAVPMSFLVMQPISIGTALRIDVR